MSSCRLVEGAAGQQGLVSRRLAGLAALTLLAGSTAACGDDATDPQPSGDATSIATTTASAWRLTRMSGAPQRFATCAKPLTMDPLELLTRIS